jgi:hypothetical protein
MCSFSQNGPIFVKFPVIFLQLFVPDPDRFHTCRLDLRLDRAELSLACGSRCGSNGKAARQGPAARLWILSGQPRILPTVNGGGVFDRPRGDA